MSRLPSVKSRELVRILKLEGFVEISQKGSHLKLIHLERNRRVIVPVHPGKDVKKGTLLSILKGAGLSVDEFLKQL